MSTPQHRVGPIMSRSPTRVWLAAGTPTSETQSWMKLVRDPTTLQVHQCHQFTSDSSRQRQNLNALKLPLSPNSQWQFVLKVNVENLRADGVKTTVPCYFLSFEAAESKNKLQRSLNKLCDGDTTWKQTQTSFQWNFSGFMRRRTDTLRSAFAWTDIRILCVMCKISPEFEIFFLIQKLI